MHAAGADHVAIIPVAPDGSTEHLPVLEALAPASPSDPLTVRSARRRTYTRGRVTERTTVATVGTGVMAESMIAGLLSGDRLGVGQILASHPRAERRAELERQLGIRTTESNTEAVEAADIVVLAIKPQMLKRVGRELAGVLRPDQLVISILAGATTTRARQRARATTPSCARCRTRPPSSAGG